MNDDLTKMRQATAQVSYICLFSFWFFFCFWKTVVCVILVFIQLLYICIIVLFVWLFNWGIGWSVLLNRGAIPILDSEIWTNRCCSTIFI
jgi:hypothetical protein